MIEMILRLFSAKPISIETAVGRSCGSIGRDEFVAAAAHGCRTHPIGWHLIMAEDACDDSSVAVLVEYLSRACGGDEVGRTALSVLLRRPLPDQLDGLVHKSPYYVAERRRASAVMERAKRSHRRSNDAEYARLKAERDAILTAAHNRVADELLQTGRCPACGGRGTRERAHDTCWVCLGTGKVVPDMDLIGRQFGHEVQVRVGRVIDAVQVDKSECLRVIRKRIDAERAAA